jgi:hypothetical protein
MTMSLIALSERLTQTAFERGLPTPEAALALLDASRAANGAG